MNYLLIPTWLFTMAGYLGPLLAACGGAVVAAALLASRRGWEPRCGRCAHDLRAIDPGARRCPECGADLSSRGAVHAGRRRVRPLLATAGLLVLACAALASWRLGPADMPAVRATVVGWSPLSTLVDAVFEGGPDAELAQAVLLDRLGSGNRRSGGAPRTVPSGELLDALLAAADRCDEPGRRPLSAVLQSSAVKLVARLDAAEETRLIELAAGELAATDGRSTGRLRLALAMGVREAGAESPRARIATLLASSDSGRELLEPQPVATARLSSGAFGSFLLRSTFDRIAPNGVSAGDPSQSRIREEARTFILGEALLETVDGAPIGRLANARDRMFSVNENPGLGVALLVDAPPGRYRLRLTGAVVATALLRRTAQPGRFIPMITMDDALRLEGATRIESAGEIEVAARAHDVVAYTTDAAAVARVAELLGKSRFEPDDERSIDFHDLLNELGRGGGGAGVEPRVLSRVRAEQDGRTEELGRLSGDVRTVGDYPRDVPNGIDVAKPFVIVLSPDMADSDVPTPAIHPWGGGDQAAGPMRPTVLATFVLRFPNARGAPVVEVVAATSEPAVARRRDDEPTRSAVARWAALLSRRQPQEPGARAGTAAASRPRPSVSLDRDSETSAGTAGRPAESAEWPWPADLHLCGWVEQRAGARLVAPVARAFGPMRDGIGNRLPALVVDVAPGEPLIVRYVPDGEARSNSVGGTFDYLAAPFELRYAANGAAPEIVWLESARETAGGSP